MHWTANCRNRNGGAVEGFRQIKEPDEGTGSARGNEEHLSHTESGENRGVHEG